MEGMRMLMQGTNLTAACLIYGLAMQEHGEERELRDIQDSSFDATR